MGVFRGKANIKLNIFNTTWRFSYACNIHN
jgi:hypothetical protein